MANYKIVVQYDGTAYKGWQVQNSTKDTIQGKIQRAISKVVEQNVEIDGSGRTDAGVHAIGQVATFKIKQSELSDKELLLAINKKLPEDISIISLEQVDERFHARYSEKGKTYRYRIHVSPVSSVFDRRFTYTYLDKPLDIELMRQAAKKLEGRHDFKSFCGNKHMKKSTVRTVTDIKITEIRDEHGLKEIDIDYTGDGFLMNMIRIMTGTLIEVGTGRKTVEEIDYILEALDRDKAGYTAPPQGLCLLEVYY